MRTPKPPKPTTTPADPPTNVIDINVARRPKAPRQTRVPAPRLYVYFDAIIRHGSIRSAAEALRIASSALNRRLLDLEQDVGTVLFHRLPGGVRLTPAGEIFAAHVRRMLGDIEQVGDAIEGLHGTPRGHVAIGSAESAAVDFLPQVLAAFQREHVGIRFTVAVGAPREMLADLLDERADLILTHQEPAHQNVAVLAAAREDFCALMRHDHPLAGRPTLMLQDCGDFPVVLAEESLAARALLDATLNSVPLRVQPVLITNMFEVMKHYVRLTDAISFHFTFHPSPAVARAGLVAIPLADPQLVQSRLMLAVKRNRMLSPGISAICATLQQGLQALSAR